MTSMIEDGFYRAVCGETTLGEVLSLVKTLQFPRVRRDAEEVERLLVGEMSDEEMENAVYGGYDNSSPEIDEETHNRALRLLRLLDHQGSGRRSDEEVKGLLVEVEDLLANLNKKQ